MAMARCGGIHDHGFEERTYAMSRADELWLHECYWRDSLHRSAIEVSPVYSVHLSGALWTRTRRLATERGPKVSRIRKLITRCVVNRVALRNDLIGDDYWVAVEMMDPDDALRGPQSVWLHWYMKLCFIDVFQVSAIC